MFAGAMHFREPEKSLRAAASAGIMLLCAVLVSPVGAQNCPELDRVAIAQGARIPGHASGHVVVGKGRLQFFSAPNVKCPMNGVFILPGESVDAYVLSDGFMSVMYLNPRTGNDALGWVEAARLKPTGQGIAPRP
ncbi:MAG: hypothetical protein RLY71_2788 [Pseudomonadota bacterium]|jgi:hypothetical protein